MNQRGGIKDYIIANIPRKLSYIFRSVKPCFEKDGDDEIIKFSGFPKYFIIPRVTLDEIYAKWEEYKYDMEKTTDWLAEKILSKLSCKPIEPSNEQGKVIVLMGNTCCGKTTLKNMLIQNNIAEGITTYTTRKPRKDEDAFSYHFIEKDDFVEKIKNDFFLETSIVDRPTKISENETKYETIYFGSALDDYKGEKLKVIVLDVNGYLNIKDKISCIPVYITVSEETILKRCHERGEDTEKTLSRVYSEDFDKHKDVLFNNEKPVFCLDGNQELEVVYNNLLDLIKKEN